MKLELKKTRIAYQVVNHAVNIVTNSYVQHKFRTTVIVVLL